MNATYRITVGSAVIVDDELYEVRQVSAESVVLCCVASNSSIVMSLVELLTKATHPHRGASSRMELGLELATPAERALVERRRYWIEWVENPQDAESQSMPLKDRRAIACKQLGESERTYYRLNSKYRDRGEAGLVPETGARNRKNRLDGVWEDVAAGFLEATARKTSMTRRGVIAEVTDRVKRDFPDSDIPSQSTCYEILDRLSKGREFFGSASARLSIANSPKNTFGRLVANKHGEFVVLDTHDLDVLVRTPRDRGSKDFISRPQLTVAMDVYTRSIVAITLATSTNQGTVASVLFEMCQPVPWPDRVPENCRFDFHGVPDAIFVGDRNDHWALPYAPPDSIITDHGKPFTAAHIRSICTKLGISVQLAQTYKPTDKPWLERFFRSLNDGLISKLPGYVGSSVVKRGPAAEEEAVFFVDDLEFAIRDWVCSVYHRTKHAGLCFPEIPERSISPAEMYRLSIATHGLPCMLLRPEDAFDFLITVERVIQPKGVSVQKRIYNGPALDAYRGKESTEPRVGRPDKFRFKVDPQDVRHIWFQDPSDLQWNKLEWVEAQRLGRPFSLDEYMIIGDLFVEPLPDRATLEHELAKRTAGRAEANRKESNRARRIVQHTPTPVERMSEAHLDWSINTGDTDHSPPRTVDVPDASTQEQVESEDLDSIESDLGWGTADSTDQELDFFFTEDFNE